MQMKMKPAKSIKGVPVNKKLSCSFVECKLLLKEFGDEKIGLFDQILLKAAQT